MKKQKPHLQKLSLRKTAIAPLSDQAGDQVKGGATQAFVCPATRASICNACIPATEYLSCRCA